VPDGVTDRDIVGFYVQKLRATWAYDLQQLPVIESATGAQVGEVVSATFTQGSTTLMLDMHGMLSEGAHAYALQIVSAQ
jgi:hypothetical protein